MNNSIRLAAIMIGAYASAAAFAGAQMDPGLKPFFMKESQSGYARVIALMSVNSHAESMPKKYDRLAIPRYLRFISTKAWQEVERDLAQKKALGKSVKILQGNWINASFTALVTPEGLKALSEAAGIEKIYLDRRVKNSRPADVKLVFKEGATMPYNFKDTAMEQVIAEMPQVNGKGVTLGVLDTGAEGKHEALAGKIIDFYDASVKKHTDPRDDEGHGTHVSGTVAGGGRQGANPYVGIAPEAKLLVAAGLSGEDFYSSMLRAMEYFLDPDQNPATADQPRAVNNSWHAPGAPDIELFYRAISAWEAAGILPVFAAGNSYCNGGGKTIGNPQTHPLAFAVGATGANGKVTDFSSCGPGNFKGKDTQKPDITAPGEDIVSSVPGGRYSEMSGTSMASPHVTGTAGLLFQVNPRLTPAQVREILIRSATPTDENGGTGAPGAWNRRYGFGKLNIYKAVKIALSMVKGNTDHFGGILGMNLFSEPATLEAKWIEGSGEGKLFSFNN